MLLSIDDTAAFRETSYCSFKLFEENIVKPILGISEEDILPEQLQLKDKIVLATGTVVPSHRDDASNLSICYWSIRLGEELQQHPNAYFDTANELLKFF